MSKIIFILLITITSNLFCQDLQEKIVLQSFSEYAQDTIPKKVRLNFTGTYAKVNPFNYLGAGLLYVYQKIFSEQFQADCSYQISCSEYTRLAINKSGFLLGTLMGFNQLSECIPAAKYEHPRSFLNHQHKIVNTFEISNK